MKKLILPTTLFAFILQSFFGHAYAQEEPSNKLRCDQIWSIVGTDECRNWVVNNDEGGVWCNLPESRESLQPWIYGPPPTYTFTPGTCGEEEGDQPQEEPETKSEEQNLKSNPITSSAKALSDWITETFGKFDPGDPTIEALVDVQPTDSDLQPVSPPAESDAEPVTGMITKLDGFADMQLKDGTWVELKKGDFVPADAKVFTGYDVRLEVKLSDNLILNLDSLEEFNLELFQTDPRAAYPKKELKLDDGALRFKVEERTSDIYMKSLLKVTTPNASASITGTDFGVAYNKGNSVSIWEIYDGSIEVENTITGEKTILSSRYGSPIKRLEVSNDGVMAEKIAVPKNQKGGKIPIWVYAVGVAVLIVGGLAFLKWTKRKASGSRR